MTGERPRASAQPRDSALSPAAEPGGPLCSGEACITCGDVAVEVRVVRLLPDALAVVDTGQGDETVSVALVTAVPGDTILVHAGEAIATVRG